MDGLPAQLLAAPAPGAGSAKAACACGPAALGCSWPSPTQIKAGPLALRSVAGLGETAGCRQGKVWAL